VIVHRDHRSGRTALDEAGQLLPVLAVADQERLDRQHVRIGRGLHPIAEIDGAETGDAHAFPVEPGGVAVFNRVPFVYYNDHRTPESFL
jgi:hypothetical protein